MNWSVKALDLLDALTKDVPGQFRERAKANVVAETENFCRQSRVREVGYDQVVVGYIRHTPAHLRQGLRTFLAVKGVPLEKFEGHIMSP